jgi:hypothetical protein
MNTGTWKWAVPVLAAALLLMAGAVWAQWGVLQKGVDRATKGSPGQPATAKEDKPHNVADTKVGGAGLTSATTFKNKVRPFSYTIPAGWRQEGGGDPAGARVQFMLLGTTAGFTFHFTQMVPSFPRKPRWTRPIKPRWRRKVGERAGGTQFPRPPPTSSMQKQTGLPREAGLCVSGERGLRSPGRTCGRTAWPWCGTPGAPV